MPETKIPVKRQMIHYKCDDCLTGYMLLQPKQPLIKTNNAAMYYYKCTNCNKEKLMDKMYPMIGDDVPDNIPMPNLKIKRNDFKK